MTKDNETTDNGSGLAPGSFCWTEIAVNDAEKCKSFYRNVFGWEFKEGSSPYYEFSTGGPEPSGGLYEISAEMIGEGQLPPPHFMTYIAVEDVDSSAEQARKLGGTVDREPMDLPGVGRFAMVKDPTGATFSIFQAAEGRETNG